MFRTKLSQAAIALVLLAAATPSAAQRRISEDRDLIEIDLTGWDCLQQQGGSAKTPDGVERNQKKNRAPIDLTGVNVPRFDTTAFLRHVSAFDAQTKGKRRKDLSGAQKQQLEALEKQVVSLTAYLVIVYAGPPESTNCGSVDFHDWHLEVFDRPLDHAPRIGDPTPIICETAPRTQNALFRDGVRLQKLAGFFRRPDVESEPLGQPPQQVRITGFLTWDDDHNGAADIGPSIRTMGKNKYHQPWRSTAWEIHPVLKIESADGKPMTPSAPTVAAIPALPSSAPPPAQAPATATPQPMITIVEPVKIKIPYGEMVLPRGMKLPLVSRDAQTATVTYMGQAVAVPLRATDLN